MGSYTRRNFIRRGAQGAAGLGMLMGAKQAPAAVAPQGQEVSPSPGQPRSAPGRAVEVTVTRNVVRENFGGVGFHAEMFLNDSTPDFFDQVVAKRWRELNPRFARLFHPWQPDRPGTRDAKALEAMARQLVFMKEAAGTEIYLTTGELKDTVSEEDRHAYAQAVVDDLEYLINQGATNLKYYCSTNELSLGEWAGMHRDLPRFRSYHQPIFEEIKRRKLGIKLLATDASPIEYWHTLTWAAQNMDDITGIYGGHHYINEHAPDDLSFYAWFRDKCRWAVDLARSKGKDFILGEFGPAQYQELKYAVRWDTCKYYGTPLEPLAGVQLAEAAIAALNAGVYAMGYWTFMDYPDTKGQPYINQWGLFKWLTNGGVTRAPYYAYGLLTKFFRGPATVYQVDAGDEKLRAVALQHAETKTWSVAVLSRAAQDVAIKLSLGSAGPAMDFRKYLYDPRNVPVTEDGDLQEPEGKLALRDGQFTDTLRAGTLAVYTTAYDDAPPAPVRGLDIARIRDTRVPGSTADARRLRWTANTESDLCYYRVFHNGVRIASTVGTEFIDAGPTAEKPGKYSVVAVDRSGNHSG
ncbi:MAG: hypothetical protein ABSG54_19030 [Terriglobia bacterium]|jgi:hypothetical protein